MFHQLASEQDKSEKGNTYQRKMENKSGMAADSRTRRDQPEEGPVGTDGPGGAEREEEEVEEEDSGWGLTVHNRIVPEDPQLALALSTLWPRVTVAVHNRIVRSHSAVVSLFRRFFFPCRLRRP